MIRTCLIGLMVLLGTAACRDIENAEPMKRYTFARFYESAQSRSGVMARPLDGGFVVLGNSITPTDTTGLVMRTDAKGNLLWTTELQGIALKSLQVTQDALYVFGDSIVVNPESEALADLIIYSALLYKLDLNGVPGAKLAITDRDTINRIDYKASALTVNGFDELILLGTFKAPAINATERPFIAALSTGSLDTLWTKQYNIIDRDYVNSRSVHCTSEGYVVWASAILKEQQSFDRSYLSIPFVKESSVFENSDVYGSTTDQKLLVGDIQPSSTPEFGYGIVGTYASPGGDNSNVFFGRVTSNGNFIVGSERFFDGQLSSQNQPVDPGASSSQDTGDALCATRDGGYVLAGTMNTTPTRGNGGKDLFLLKVDAMGNILWNRVVGGSGDETISSIIETEDRGLLMCGSKDASGLPAIFLMKTNPIGIIED